MSAPTTIRRELLNVAFLAFIPVGEVVDSVTIAEATWPDNVPTTNYSNYEIHDVETLLMEKTFDTETFKIPKASGGYQDDDENTVKKVLFKGKSAKTSSYFKQLEHGLATVPVVGTAQAPYVNNNDYIEGVVLIEFQNKSGTVTERLQIWARLRLDNPGETGPTTRKLEFSIEKRDSSNNTYMLVA
jgi:hypothetical protein